MKGDVSLTRLETFVETLLKLMAQGSDGFTLKTSIEGRISELDREDILAELTPLLEEFEDLFAEPYGLSSKRDRDHAIWLVEGG